MGAPPPPSTTPAAAPVRAPSLAAVSTFNQWIPLAAPAEEEEEEVHDVEERLCEHFDISSDAGSDSSEHSVASDEAYVAEAWRQLEEQEPDPDRSLCILMPGEETPDGRVVLREIDVTVDSGAFRSMWPKEALESITYQ